VSASKNRLSEREKARRWDQLIACLRRPEMRDAYIHRLSGTRRAVYLLLAGQEALAAELKAYKVTVDALYLEAADGFAAIEGVLNLLPTYITESVAGELCQDEAGKKDWAGT
jgi:hypothetical protein